MQALPVQVELVHLNSLKKILRMKNADAYAAAFVTHVWAIQLYSLYGGCVPCVWARRFSSTEVCSTLQCRVVPLVNSPNADHCFSDGCASVLRSDMSCITSAEVGGD